MLAELVIAVAIVMMLLGSVFSLVDPTRGALAVRPHVADTHQRLRAAFVRLQTDFMLAGSGPHPTLDVSVARLRAPVLPALVAQRHPPAAGATFAADAVTILYAPPRSPAAPLASPLAGPAADVQLAPGPARCRAGATTCAFEAGSLALGFDRDGRSDIVRVTRVFDDALRVQPIGGGSVQTFAAGASIVPLELRSYYHDRAAAQLRYQDGWVTDVPVLDDVVGLTLRYFGGGALPAGAGGDGPAAACLRGRPPHAPPGGPGGNPERELAPSSFLDGPRCGGRLPYDVDLFRIRRVRVEIRLQVFSAWLRGRDPSLFARPGPARDGRRQVPDLTGVFEVAPRGVLGP